MKTCYVIGGGASLKDFDFSRLEGADIIGVNDSMLLPLPILCGVFRDNIWAVTNREAVAAKIAEGTKVYTNGNTKVPGVVVQTNSSRFNNTNRHDMTTLPFYRCSGNSGIALAAMMGYKRICLLGFDCHHVEGESHWHTPRVPQRTSVYASFISRAKTLADDMEEHFPGVEVLNMYPEGQLPSSIPCWPILEFELYPSEESMSIKEPQESEEGFIGPLKEEIPTTVVWVYKTGGIYDGKAKKLLKCQHLAIKSSINANISAICLTDAKITLPKGIKKVKLQFDLPGWFSKFELFRDDYLPDGQRVIFIDLDTVLHKGLDDLLDLPLDGFYMLEDFYHPDRHASGVMVFESNRHKYLLDQFLKAKDSVSYRSGDQRFVAQRVARQKQTPLHKLQTELPDTFYSYKVHVRDGNMEPEACPILCYHGNPRPWHVNP